MKKFIFCMLVLCISSKVEAEEISWGSSTTYAPMPVLFIHGINSNALTWQDAIRELERYFGYRWVQFNEPNKPISKDDRAVSVDRDNPDAPQNKVVKHYLEAFDYGGKDYVKSFYPLSSQQPELKELIEGSDKFSGILKSYYGDNWKDNPDAKIIIVGYSMGGLIAREYVQTNPGLSKHIKRLITIGTPHYGSYYLANLMSLIIKEPGLSPVVHGLRLNALIKIYGKDLVR